jgi:FkbM family methyltransferase
MIFNMAINSLFKPFGLIKPEYVFQPSRLLARFRLRSPLGSGPEKRMVRLACGLPMWISPTDVIGQAVLRFGLFDLAVTEVLWRLVRPGDQVLDIGANIGAMTAVLTARVGAKGTVHAFEAHPLVCRDLLENIHLWKPELQQVVNVHNVALSAEIGGVKLMEPECFKWNRGTARVAAQSEAESQRGVEVDSKPLDFFLPRVAVVQLAKMDVEGHEALVLKGARKTLQTGKVRSWVFEENAGYPSEATRLFEDNGYRVFEIRKHFSGVRLSQPQHGGSHSSWESPSFLATRCAEEVLTLFEKRGWQCLRHG